MKPKRISELDGIRAFAILPVLLTHLAPESSEHAWEFARFGWVGVDIFFVLSGFLITGILLKAKTSTTYYRNFYARRILRIWPVYFTILFLVLGVIPLVRPNTHDHPEIGFWAFALFVQNLFPLGKLGRALGPTWSLGVEEQFYLIWPFVVARFTSKGLFRLLVLAIAVSPLIRMLVVRIGGDPMYAYTATFCRLDGLAAGAALSITLTEGWLSHPMMKRISSFLMLVSLPLIIIYFSGQSGVGLDSPWIFSLLAAFATATVSFALLPGASYLKTVLNLRPLQFIGKISYGLYLWHTLVYLFLEKSFLYRVLRFQHHRSLSMFAVGTLEVAAAICVATASWYLLEQPCLRFKERFEGPAQQALTKSAVTAS
jgi:peptidoglycan/LPS O-acetylase OafA/YrhL